MRRLTAALGLVLLLGLGGCGRAAKAQGPGFPELIFVQAQAQGVAGTFLVDTGAPTTVLDAAFARRARVRLGADQVLNGGGGSVTGRIAEGVAVQAEGGPRLTLDPATADLSALARAFGHPFDGVLGADYFAHLVVSLDYRGGHVRFTDPAKLTPPAGAVRLTLLTTPFVQAAAQLNGRKALGSYQIDTGSNTAVSFWRPFAAKAFPGVRGTTGTSLGLGGSAISRMAPLDSLELAGRTVTGLTADLASEVRPDDAGPDFIGTLGGPAFAGRVLNLDFARARMWLD